MQDNPSAVFAPLAQGGHEQVLFCQDQDTGLRAIIAIHNTRLGPALGGCRMYPYASEQEALTDVLRLSRGMTYKAAVSGLDLGGGKAVIIADPKLHKTEGLWRAFGRAIQTLGGRYITAEDVGTTMEDMETIRAETNHVVGISRALGGSGDPSPVTALGVFGGLQAAVEEAFPGEGLANKTVAVQGCGHVGYHLIGHLVRAGAKVVATDVDAEACARVVEDFKVTLVPPQDIYSVPCDIFAPCAMGGILNARTIPQLSCKVIAGAANNQLADENIDGPMLSARGITYAPDFVINAGGLINVANEIEGYNQERALGQAKRIYQVMQRIFAHAKQAQVPTFLAANAIAQERIRIISSLQRPRFSAHNTQTRGA